MADVVYWLGAGFSRAVGGPLLREMLDTSDPKNEGAVGELWRRDEFKVLMKVLKRLPPEERNIEGLFNVVSSGVLYGDTIGGYDPSDLRDFLIQYVSLLVAHRVGDPSKKGVYRRFRDSCLADEHSAVVTFNYDLVVEPLLEFVYGGFDYGLPKQPKFRYFRLRGARRGPPLLKLHGSLSWLACGSCHSVWMHDTYAIHKRGSRCLRTSCSGLLKPLIVPPMWNKEATAKEISIIWAMARGLLVRSQRIVVIGFSFPPLDRAAIDLMRSVLRDNPRIRVDVYNGPNYDYAALRTMLGRKLRNTGGKLEDLTG